MSTKKIGSAFDLPLKSFNLVKKNWQMFLLLNVLSIASGLSLLIKGNSNDHKTFYENFDFSGLTSSSQLGESLGIGIIAIIGLLIISIFVSAMHTALELKASQGNQPDLNELIDDGKRYWAPLFIQTILITLIIVVGLILLIVPGVIAFGRLVLAPYIMIDKKLGIIESMKASNELAKEHQNLIWSAVGVLFLVSLAAGVLSAIPRAGTLINVLVMIPFSLIIPIRYLQIKNLSKTPRAS